MSKKLKEKINEKWDDAEVLENFGLFLDRVTATTAFLGNDDGHLTHEVMVFQSGDKVLVSDPRELDVPLTLAMPTGKVVYSDES